MRVRKVILISIGEFSMKTARTIEIKVQELCIKYRVRHEIDNKNVLWGAKVSAILEGDMEDISLIIKCLRVDFKVKLI